MYTERLTLKSRHYTITQHTAFYKLLTAHCTLQTVQYTHYTMHPVNYKLQTANCTSHTVHNTNFTLHTMHTTNFILHTVHTAHSCPPDPGIGSVVLAPFPHAPAPAQAVLDSQALVYIKQSRSSLGYTSTVNLEMVWTTSPISVYHGSVQCAGCSGKS